MEGSGQQQQANEILNVRQANLMLLLKGVSYILFGLLLIAEFLVLLVECASFDDGTSRQLFFIALCCSSTARGHSPINVYTNICPAQINSLIPLTPECPGIGYSCSHHSFIHINTIFHWWKNAQKSILLLIVFYTWKVYIYHEMRYYLTLKYIYLCNRNHVQDRFICTEVLLYWNKVWHSQV